MNQATEQQRTAFIASKQELVRDFWLLYNNAEKLCVNSVSEYRWEILDPELDTQRRDLLAEHPQAYKTFVERLTRDLQYAEQLAAVGINDLTDASALFRKELPFDFLIDGVLIKREAGIIAGPSKCLKTSIAVDMALSVATGTPMLGEFEVPEPSKVIMFSVESGERSLRWTMVRQMQDKGITPDMLIGKLFFHASFIPSPSNESSIVMLQQMLDRHKPGLVIFDPLYFMLDGDNASNQANQGQELRRLAELVKEAGATPLFVDHTKMNTANVSNYQPLELSDLSGAAKAAFARQWLLLNRRSKFDEEAWRHDLWMTYGGSAGHRGGRAVDVDETKDSDGNTTWSVDVRSIDECKREADASRERDKANKAEKREADKLEEARMLLQQLIPLDAEVSKNGITKKHRGKYVGLAIDMLVARGEMVENPEFKSQRNQSCVGLSWTKNARHRKRDS